jgi:hypothetical protein
MIVKTGVRGFNTWLPDSLIEKGDRQIQTEYS